jgi:signal transduction histidine kinase
MSLETAEQQKAFNAERQISYIRAIIIVFGTITFFFLDDAHVKKHLSYFLLSLIWLYGFFVLYFKPYEKYPIFLASWFTYISDCVFATLWIYATGGIFSPYHAMLYTSIIAVAFRFDLKTTLFTASLYAASYFLLTYCLGQLEGHIIYAVVRMGFVFIIGFLTNLITKETLNQTQQKLDMQRLVKEATEVHRMLADKQAELASVNEALKLKNNIFSHAEENAGIGSYAWNLGTGRLDYSDNLFRLLGREPGSFVPTLEKYLDFIHPGDRNAIMAQSTATLRNRVAETFVHRLITAKGELKYMRATGSILGEGEDTIMIGTLQDITEDVHLNEQLKQKNLELEISNEQLASFNYIASHDLQEPVRKIAVFSNLVLEKERNGLPEKVIDYLERISFSAMRMQRLILAFLNYSRLGNASAAFENTDLNVLVKDVLTDLNDLVMEKKAVIECSQLPSLPVVPLQFHQVMVNLVNNALKYSRPEAPPHITISAKQVAGPASGQVAAGASAYWKISVEDNGIGFEVQYADKIFEMFQRLHGRDKYEGSGIGLAICKKIISLHHGFMDVSSTPGKGSMFNIYLPIREQL